MGRFERLTREDVKTSIQRMSDTEVETAAFVAAQIEAGKLTLPWPVRRFYGGVAQQLAGLLGERDLEALTIWAPEIDQIERGMLADPDGSLG